MLVQEHSEVFLGHFGQPEWVQGAPGLRVTPAHAVAQCVLLFDLVHFGLDHGGQQLSHHVVGVDAHLAAGVGGAVAHAVTVVAVVREEYVAKLVQTQTRVALCELPHGQFHVCVRFVDSQFVKSALQV